MRRCSKTSYLLAILILASFSFVVHAQQAPKRLILKDGSYQLATQWEIKGDRVRFYSSERYDWEELPTVLIDWLATERYNRDMAADRASGGPLLDKNAAKEDDAGKPETPPVAPGLNLPDDGGVFLLDVYQNQPQLVPLEQSGGELNKQMGRNILRAAVNPLALSTKEKVELKGAHAASQAHVAQPVIYLQMDPGETPADAAQVPHAPDATHPADERYRIVRMESKKGVRVLGDLNIGVTGKMKEKENWVPTSSTRFGEWTRIIPSQPLVTGEYAVVELLDKGQINLYVWDFGVDPSAPANAKAQSARPANPDTTPPVLKKKFF